MEQDLFVQVNKGQVYVKRWVPDPVSDLAPLILFHDSLGSISQWKDFPSKLSVKLNREVIAYDRLGFGKSTERTDLPTTKFISDEVDVFSLVLKQLNINNFILFGHSVGGGMAVVCAGVFTDKCKAVITEASQAFVEEKTIVGIENAIKEFEKPEVLNRLKKYHGEKALWILKSWSTIWLSPEYRHWSLKSYLPKVKCPLLAIHGDKDEYGSSKFPEMISGFAGGPSEMKILNNIGHAPHKENEELILQITAEFLQKHRI